MTKRELCRKLLILNLDSAGIASAWGDWNYDLDAIDNAIRAAILNLVPDEAPEDKEDAKELTDKPFVRTCNDKFAYTSCNCGGKAYVKMRFHEGEAFVAKCAKCGNVLQGVPDWRIDWTNDPPPENLFAEEKPEAEEKHPGVIAKPGKDGEIEFCWCQKCYEQAAVVHDPFGDGENWSYCKNCGVSFRLKRGEGEK